MSVANYARHIHTHNLAGRGLTEEQRHLQSEALKFARNELSPHMRDWDQEVNRVLPKPLTPSLLSVCVYTKLV